MFGVLPKMLKSKRVLRLKMFKKPGIENNNKLSNNYKIYDRNLTWHRWFIGSCYVKYECSDINNL